MIQKGVITYPIPEYQNVSIHAEYYQPHRFIISDIALGTSTIVTTIVAHDYFIGQQVRLIIPPTFGSRGLNEKKGYVRSIPSSTSVVLDIFSIGIDPFINSSATTKAQILAIGNVNSGQINDQGRVYLKPFIPGSFLDISPI